MVMSGPGIKPMSTFKHVASNVDVAPTLLGLAVRCQLCPSSNMDLDLYADAALSGYSGGRRTFCANGRPVDRAVADLS